MIKHAESNRAYYWPDDDTVGVDYVLSKRTPSNMKAGDCWCHVHCFKEMTGRRVFPRDCETSGKTNRKNQTYSPHSDYKKLRVAGRISDRHHAEKRAHVLAEKTAAERSGEWFRITDRDAKEVLRRIETETKS